MPSVSVLLAVHNGGPWLHSSIQSILDQTYGDFELLVMDDGSTDDSRNVIQSFNDPRIRFFSHPESRGLAASLNELVKQAHGAYLARMDADDVSLPERLEKQVAFFDGHPDIAIMGTAAQMIDENGKTTKNYHVPLTHGAIKWRALFANPLIHPSVMTRAEVLRANPYDESFPNSQDYDLWSRLLFGHNTRFANLHEALLEYRIHPSSTTARRDDGKKRLSTMTSLTNIKRYLAPTTQEEASYLRFRSGERISFRDAYRIDRLIKRLHHTFLNTETLAAGEQNEIRSLVHASRISLVKQLAKQILRP